MLDDSPAESGDVLPPEGGGDEMVLQFPVEIEVRMVAPYDPEQLVSAALDRLTAALQGLT